MRYLPDTHPPRPGGAKILTFLPEMSETLSPENVIERTFETCAVGVTSYVLNPDGMSTCPGFR
ncbi:hypothetical protein SBA4_1980020 [Candidatus Sulfopaludibacter sp. SbA4]|nr:hypothetical protein SBA4_1980020 [Candidatus Sulfopaludibacter sp. SbA4]